MKKISVVLLILAVAWGAFAEDAEGGWGSITGSAELSTTVDLYNGNTDVDQIGIRGAPGDAQLNVTWSWKKGDWEVNLPLRAHSNGYFGTAPHDKSNDVADTSANVTYNPDGGLKVTIPFSFKFQAGQGLVPIMWNNANVKAEYDGGTYHSTVQLKNLLTNGGVALGAVGGWYQFADGAAQLNVSYNEAYETKWWRASEVVIGYGTPGDLARAINPKISFWFEDIKPNNGIAFKYNVMESLNIGIAFAGNAGAAMFGGSTSGVANNSFLNDFLLQPTIGAKFTSDMVDVSFMVGFRTFKDAAGGIESLGVPLHAGVMARVMDNLKVQGDISAYFLEDIALFNAGLRATFGDPDAVDNFWARLNVPMYDFAGTFGDYGSPVIGIQLNVGYNIKYDGDNPDVGKDNTGLYGHLYFRTNDIASDFLQMNVTIRGGYKGFELTEKLLLSADARIIIEAATVFTPYAEVLDATPLANGRPTSWQPRFKEETKMMVGFKIAPSIEWKLIDKGSITATYTIGATDLMDSGLATINGVNENNLKFTFKWSF